MDPLSLIDQKTFEECLAFWNNLAKFAEGSASWLVDEEKFYRHDLEGGCEMYMKKSFVSRQLSLFFWNFKVYNPKLRECLLLYFAGGKN